MLTDKQRKEIKARKEVKARKKVGQGIVWCTACDGTGEHEYINFKEELVKVKCPICKGSKMDSFKGKGSVSDEKWKRR